MESLIIKPKDDKPEIILDKGNRIFRIAGKSMPEDVLEFYKPVLDWFQMYLKNPLEETILDVDLEYFNTASSKVLLDIFTLLEELAQSGKKAEVNWHYPDYDEDMMEAGEEYSELVELKFNLLPYKED